MNKLRVLFVVIALCCSSAICAQTTYYYKLTKKIQDGVEYTNTAGGQFVSFVNNICYDSDKYGISVGNGQLTFYEEYSNTSKTYIGNSYFGNVVYRFKTDMSVLNIIVNKNLIYVYTKTTPANNILTCSLIRKKETNSGSGEIKVNTSQFQFNTAPMPVNTYSGGYDNNNTNTNKNNKGLEKAKEYYDSYGEKDCPSCHGSGTCSTCNGKGWFYSSYGTGKVDCPNCCYSNKGKCGRCCGTGKVYGKKY